MKKFVLVLITVSMTIFPLLSGDVKIKGFVQTWFSVGPQYTGELTGDTPETETVTGFKINRMRLKFYGKLSKNVKWYVQFIGDNAATPKLLDAALMVKFSEEFNIKVGQFVSPGPASGCLTPSSKIDFVERAQITKLWSGFNGLLGWRAMGVQFYGNLAKGKIYYALMVANPKTILTFNPSIKSSLYSGNANQPAVLGRIEIKPTKCITIGAFGTQSKTTDDVERTSYGANLFFMKNGFKLKGEYISGTIDTGIETNYEGFFVTAGYKFNKIEPILRFDTYTPNKDSYDTLFVEKYNNVTAGLNYYFNKNIKIQINYVMRSENMAEGANELENNLFYVNFQYSF